MSEPTIDIMDIAMGISEWIEDREITVFEWAAGDEDHIEHLEAAHVTWCDSSDARTGKLTMHVTQSQNGEHFFEVTVRKVSKP